MTHQLDLYMGSLPLRIELYSMSLFGTDSNSR